MSNAFAVTVLASAVLGLSVSAFASEPVSVTAFAIGGKTNFEYRPSDIDSDYFFQDKRPVWGALLSVKKPFGDGWFFKAEPTIQKGSFNLSDVGEYTIFNSKQKHLMFGLPVGVGYEFVKGLSGFATAGAVVGRFDATSTYTTPEADFEETVKHKKTSVGAMGSVGIEYEYNHLAIRAAYQFIDVNSTTFAGPVFGLGYKF